MQKTPMTRALFVAGVLALAGAAQAQTFDTPTQAGEASTMTQGAPNLETTNSPYGDGSHTVILGAGPTVVSGTTIDALPAPVYSSPDTVVSYGAGWPPVQGGATETSNVPERAGEASTMSNGVPNVATSN